MSQACKFFVPDGRIGLALDRIAAIFTQKPNAAVFASATSRFQDADGRHRIFDSHRPLHFNIDLERRRSSGGIPGPSSSTVNRLVDSSASKVTRTSRFAKLIAL